MFSGAGTLQSFCSTPSKGSPRAEQKSTDPNDLRDLSLCLEDGGDDDEDEEVGKNL